MKLNIVQFKEALPLQKGRAFVFSEQKFTFSLHFSNLLAILLRICYNKIKKSGDSPLMVVCLKMIGRTLWEKFFVK